MKGALSDGPLCLPLSFPIILLRCEGSLQKFNVGQTGQVKHDENLKREKHEFFSLSKY